MNYQIATPSEICTVAFWRQYKGIDSVYIQGDPVLPDDVVDAITRWMSREAGIALPALTKSNFVVFVERFSSALGKKLVVRFNLPDASADEKPKDMIESPDDPPFLDILSSHPGNAQAALWGPPKRGRRKKTNGNTK
jgi:hypothetical protein